MKEIIFNLRKNVNEILLVKKSFHFFCLMKQFFFFLHFQLEKEIKKIINKDKQIFKKKSKEKF